MHTLSFKRRRVICAMQLPKRPTEASWRSDSGQPAAIGGLVVDAAAENQAGLRAILNQANWRLDHVRTVAETQPYVHAHKPAVVICERDLPDGDWKMVLDLFEDLPTRPNLIVTSRLADEALWAEVLNLGGYDVLQQPFDADEVCRVVFLAWHEHHRRDRVPKPSPNPANSMTTRTARL